MLDFCTEYGFALYDDEPLRKVSQLTELQRGFRKPASPKRVGFCDQYSLPLLQ